MKPESNSRRLFGITRSKGKMFELGLPEAQHIAIPRGSDPRELFVLTIGTLGDVAASMNEAAAIGAAVAPRADDLEFSSSFFDAFIASRLNKPLDRETLLLGAAA